MLINGKRALAYIVTVDEVRPIPNYDRVEHARTNGWWCVIKLGEVKPGDKAVYFEVDSKVPESDKRFEFLEAKHFKIKTQKMCKVYSQGLLLPLDMFPELAKNKVGDDVTEILGVTYAVEEDNVRKAESPKPKDKYAAMAAAYPELFRKKFFRQLMKHNWSKNILYFFLGRSVKVKASLKFSSGFPTHFEYIHKTDEERVENMPWVLGYDKPLIVTEKLDGTSTTYILERLGKNKFEFYVLSRNMRLMKSNVIYWNMAVKYDVEAKLTEYLNANPDLKYVCIQGEAVGNVQGNPLKLQSDDLYVFNFIRSDIGRVSSLEGKEIAEKMGMKFVPILDTGYHVPEDMEEFKQFATAKSAVNPEVNREGIVLRDPTSDLSFKNVSREYLLKHNG